MSAWTPIRHRRDPGLYLNLHFASLYIGPHVHKKDGSWGWGVVGRRFA